MLVQTHACVLTTALFCSFVCTASTADETGKPRSKSGSISGRIIDAKGAPLSGASVWLHKYDDKTYLVGPAILRSKVDRAGQFRFADLADAKYIVAAEADGLASSRFGTVLQAGQDQKFDITLRPAVESFVQFRDEAGQPIAGVTARTLYLGDANGSVSISSTSWQPLGISIAPSDRDGRLRLPPLSEGAVIIEAVFDCPKYSPVKLADTAITAGALATLSMRPGVTVTLHVAPAKSGQTIDHATLRLIHDDRGNPSSIFDDRLSFRPDGTATISVEPGKYTVLRLECDGYHISPVYADDVNSLRIAPGQNDDLRFSLLTTVSVTGRVTDVNGSPIKEAGIYVEVPNLPASEWEPAGGGRTDADGRCSFRVPAGPGHLIANAVNFYMDNAGVEAQIPEDGGTLPDIQLRPTPTISGRVLNADRKPVRNAILRLRGDFALYREVPAVTDADGRFQLHVGTMPDEPDFKSGPRAWSAPLDVWDSQRPQGTRVGIDFSKPESFSDITVKLAPENYDAFLQRAQKELPAQWLKRYLATQEERGTAQPKVIGQQAPPLDGAVWFNTDKSQMSLADFRGKYVLLDFWAVWCGPCHADFPEVKLLNEMYKDRGLVVIGVHDNSVDADSVRQHAKEQGLTFPIVVDRRDGTTVDAYGKIGAVVGFPNYVLIGPDGKIVEDNRMSFYKFEYIRKHLFANADSTRAADSR